MGGGATEEECNDAPGEGDHNGIHFEEYDPPKDDISDYGKEHRPWPPVRKVQCLSRSQVLKYLKVIPRRPKRTFRYKTPGRKMRKPEVTAEEKEYAESPPEQK